MTELTYSIPPALQLTLALEEARFGLSPADLFDVAVRQNEKRSFLFVSKVLGKHLSVSPAALLAAGRLLALAWSENSGAELCTGLVKGKITLPFEELLQKLDHTRIALDEPTLFIGFAETATGLARSVADSFAGDLRYISSTRAELSAPLSLSFDEAHSHARTHILHFDPADSFWKRCRRAVLVDDEFTTGRTAMRLIERLHATFGLREFVLLTLLDNSTAEERTALEQTLGIHIEVHALLKGRLLEAETGVLPPPLPWITQTHTNAADLPAYIPHALDDRQLCSEEDLLSQRDRARTLARTLTAGAGDLFLGSGEFIYLPALIAGFRGSTAFHSATQSPVLPMENSAIVSGARFAPVERYSAAGYLYNVPLGRYSRGAVIVEEGLLRPDGLLGLTAHLKERDIAEVEVLAV